MRNEKGSLTVEASIALVVFIFFIMFFLGFNSVYRAQGMVSHAVLQTSQSLAISSFLRETVSSEKTVSNAQSLLKFVETISKKQFSFDDGFQSLGASGINQEEQIRKQFVYAIADSEVGADAALKAVGVKNGLSGIDFSDSIVRDSKIYVCARYTVELPFSFFGKKEVTLTKVAVCQSMKPIA